MKDGLFIFLNPMNHNWNLIPQIVDLLDGHFEIIFFHFFSWYWFQDLSAPDAAIFPEFNPYILYQESWISNNILTMLFALLATSQSADTPPPVYSKPLLMDRPSTYALPLHLFSWRSPGGPFSQLHQTTRNLFTPFSGWSSSSPSKRNHAIPDYGKW